MSEYKTLYDKIWENHLISEDDDGTSLLYAVSYTHLRAHET